MPKINFFNTNVIDTSPTLQHYLASFSFNTTLTEEMAIFSHGRTLKHQTYVFNNLKVLSQQNLKKCLFLDETFLCKNELEKLKEELIKRGQNHDKSKFIDPEREAYVYINWQHHMEKDLKKEYIYSDEIREKIDNAILHHWKVNSHHPEFYYFKDGNTLEVNKEKIKHSLEKMSNLDLLEMLADWMAVSQEYKTDCKEFVKNNIGDGKRWPFPEEQKTKIDKIMDALEQAPHANNDSCYQQKSSLSR
ncbi:DUF5662 family protein [Rickettsiella endosymbiont of Rhagonycha lignosa]|uniref:DUF5662 family protein n=1 Tax=Rickettsiella endosymbiont of Rhagonycha lignosa TaxID=3077937 RepID=UPI00313E2EA9